MTTLRKKASCEGDQSAGFTLIEALVALAVAAVFAAVLTRVVSNVRMNAREICELVDMLTIGDSLLQQSSPQGPEVTNGYRAGFSWRVIEAPMNFTAVARRTNPKKPTEALPSTKTRGLSSSSKMSDEPDAARKDASVNWIPFHVSVLIRSRSGRSYAADTISIGRASTDE